MKHIVIIPDGGADCPLPELGGKTPFQAARTPHLDALAAAGRLRRVVTTPPGFEAGSDVCSMDLLGYDPARFHTGRAPIEAAAMGLDLRPGDWIFRMNFVTIGASGTPDEGLMLDHSAGAISDAEARELGRGLVAWWRRELGPEAGAWELTPGVSYRNILIDRSGQRGYGSIRTKPPHEMPRQPWRDLLPSANDPADKPGEAAVRTLMDLARAYLPSHPVNTARAAAGRRPANAVWIWGHGTRPDLPSFRDRFGLCSGAMITAVDLLAGIARLIGWEKVECPGITSYHDTDYAEQGRVTIRSIERYDIVCTHVESPDEASHQGDWKTKVAAVEAIDREIVGPVVEHLCARHGGDGWRVMVLPDHHTLVSTRKHDASPVPCLIAGTGIRPEGVQRFTEADAAEAPIIDPGHRLMHEFLGRAGDSRP